MMHAENNPTSRLMPSSNNQYKSTIAWANSREPQKLARLDHMVALGVSKEFKLL